jgi:hypothetical protein
MVKKLVAATLAVSVFGIAAFAESITGISNGESIAINANDENRIILNGYDENGILKTSVLFTAENGEFEIPAELTKYKLRAKLSDGFYDVEVEENPTETVTPEETAAPEETEQPSQTEQPVQTEAPTATPTAKPSTDKSFPSIYEREVDAVNAFAVVKKVSQSMNSDDEDCYTLDVLYQGKEIDVEVKQSVAISSASDEFSYMVGEDAGVLKEGDVVFLSANLSGEISQIGFIYRPLKSNIVTDGNNYGNNFAKLISANGNVAGKSGWSVLKYGASNSNAKYQFAFGVVEDKSSRSLTLLGADGSEDDALDLSIEKDTIVYVCDMSAKQEVSIGSVSSITKSSIPKNAVDSEGIITYSDSYRTNYALVRLVNGTATDIVIYTNYNK